MNKRTVAAVCFSRANYARMKSILKAIHEHSELDLKVILGASAILNRFGNVAQLVEEQGFSIAGYIPSTVEGNKLVNMPLSTGLALIEISTLLETINPDIVLTVADRHETMATAIAASYMNIPLAHTQGGEVSGSIDESVRHAITKLANIHFPSTKRACNVLKAMGEDPSSIHFVGCPAMDLLLKLPKIDSIDINSSGVGCEIDLKKTFSLVVQHPVTNEYEQCHNQIYETIKAVSLLVEKYNHQFIWLWPNIDAGTDFISQSIRSFREKKSDKNIRFYKNLSPEDYATLLSEAFCIIGNSSSGIREASFLGKLCINIGSRQNLRDRSNNVVQVDYNCDQIIYAYERNVNNSKLFKPSKLFGEGDAGIKIAKILSNCSLETKKKLHYDFIR